MNKSIAFDVYGTLVDTSGVQDLLSSYVGERASRLTALWREKQIEYSFRRALMKRYEPFTICTQEALEFACTATGAILGAEEKRALLESYQHLPVFPDVLPGLTRMKESGFRLFAFSNGQQEDLRAVLRNAELLDSFIDTVSTDEIKSFKPDPSVYAHLLYRSKSPASETWLVSSNSFDVIGALSAGLRAAWIRRSPNSILDPWGFEPTLVVPDLQRLDEALRMQA